MDGDTTQPGAPATQEPGTTTPPPETTTDARTFVDAGGAPPGETTPPPAPRLFDLLPEDLRAEGSLKNFADKDVPTLVKSYVELNKLRNERTGVKPLTPDSTPEEIVAYRQAFGIPEKADQYELSPEAQAYPEAATPTSDAVQAFLGLAHEAHLSPSQVNRVLAWHAKFTSDQYEALEDQRRQNNDAGWQALRQQYGANAEPLANMALEYLRRRYGQAAMDELNFQPGDAKALGNSPTLIKLLIESAKLTGHDKFIMGDSAGGGMLTPESARQRYDSLMADWIKARSEDDKAKMAALQQELNKLGPIAFGG